MLDSGPEVVVRIVKNILASFVRIHMFEITKPKSFSYAFYVMHPGSGIRMLADFAGNEGSLSFTLGIEINTSGVTLIQVIVEVHKAGSAY